MSLFLHAASDGSAFYLWAEAAPTNAAPAIAKRGTARREGKVNPFDAGHKALDAAAAALGLDPATARPTTATLWLPSHAGAPVPSTAIVGEIPERLQNAPPAPWQTSALRIEPKGFLAIANLGSDRQGLAPGVFESADLAWWIAAARFAAGLVRRGSIVPAISGHNGTARAVWRPVSLGRDRQALASLVQTMPDAARCAGTPDAPPAHEPSSVLGSVLETMTDAFVRGSSSVSVPPAQSIDDRWLAALLGEDAALSVDPPAMAGLQQRWDEWHRSIAITASSPVRLCFRLEEPADQETAAVDGTPAEVPIGQWTVRYLLQPHDDPSLLVPAADVWNARKKKRTLGVLADAASLREFLLVSFAEVGRLWPQAVAGLKDGIPAAHETDTLGAVEFLQTVAPALEQAGHGVFLPAWWAGKGTRTRLASRVKTRSPKMQAAGDLSLDRVVQFDWSVALGSDELSLGELQALARLKTPLVRHRGQWVLLDPAEIKAALERLRSGGGRMSAGALMRAALGADESIDPAQIEAEGWAADLLARLKGDQPLEERDPPASLDGTLRPYQRRGFSWLGFLSGWGLGACLADDMGLGKTIQTLALIAERKGSGPVLIVCPTSVVGNWQHEAARFAPSLVTMIHHGSGRTKGDAFAAACSRQDLVITSYALLQRDLEALRGVEWDGLVLDEAQNIKNPQTRQATSARALAARWRVALTGTPVENNVGDLWSILEFLNPGLLGTQADFKRRFFRPIQDERDAGAIARLKTLTGPFILRRLKTDRSIIADLPDKLEMKVFCSLTREQASLYQAVVEESLRALDTTDGIQRRGMVLAMLARLKQVCNHPAQFLADGSAIPERSGKLARLTEMVDEMLSVGERALVFTQFTGMGDIIRDHLQETFGREVLYLHGAVPKAKRDRMVERFQSDAGPPLFLLSLKAGGTGLNLTAASHVFHYDRWWNPAVENQATDRAFRIGQRRQVQVHKFVCAGTVEEKIDAMIESKRELATSVVGTGEGMLTEMSTAQLREILTLQPAAAA
jgi:SNF2 family DNA or RNA helicase